MKDLTSQGPPSSDILWSCVENGATGQGERVSGESRREDFHLTQIFCHNGREQWCKSLEIENDPKGAPGGLCR